MIRPSRPGDEAALKHLWQAAFGDSPADIDRFFSTLYQPGDAVLWADGDTVASAIYLLDPGPTLFPDGKTRTTAYAYALATLPAYRGRGLGSQVTQAAIDHSFAAGFDCNIICPAEESLFPYYIRLGYTHTLSIAEGEVSPGGPGDRFFMNQVMSISFSDYFQLRRRFLPAFSTEFPLPFFQYMEAGAKQAGAGLYQLDLHGQMACAIAEVRKGQLFLGEVLPPALAEEAARALTVHFGTPSALFRTCSDPLFPVSVPRRPFALAAYPHGASHPTEGWYFPFVLD